MSNIPARQRTLRLSASLSLIAAGFVSIGATAPSAPQARFVVATYNIRHGRGMDDSVRLTRTGEAIRALGADIVGLQEVDSVVPRIALLAEVELPSGARVLVANVHFDWVANDSFRVAQVNALAAVLDTVQLPTILLGDFNDVPGTRTLARFHSRFRGAAKPDADHFTFSSMEPVKEIDHILLAPAAAWRPAQARVITDRLTSDHRPVVAAVELITR